MRYTHKVWSQNVKGMDHLGGSETDGQITLQWTLKGVLTSSVQLDSIL